jgi:hypothetical protein
VRSAAAGSEFVIGDAPVVQFDPAPMGGPNGASGLLSSPHAHTFLPLGPEAALLITANEPLWRYFMENEARLREMTPEELTGEIANREGRFADAVPMTGFFEQLNLLSYASAQRYIFGSQKAVTEVHAFAKRHPENVAYLVPKPSQLHLVEDVPGSPGAVRIKRTVTTSALDRSRATPPSR